MNAEHLRYTSTLQQMVHLDILIDYERRMDIDSLKSPSNFTHSLFIRQVLFPAIGVLTHLR